MKITKQQAAEMLEINLEEEVTTDIVNKKYKEQALKWHPDKNPGNEAAATEQFKRVLASKKRLLQTYDESTDEEDVEPDDMEEAMEDIIHYFSHLFGARIDDHRRGDPDGGIFAPRGAAFASSGFGGSAYSFNGRPSAAPWQAQVEEDEMYTDSEDNDDDEGNFETDDSDEEIPAAYPGYSSTSAFDRGYGGSTFGSGSSSRGMPTGMTSADPLAGMSSAMGAMTGMGGGLGTSRPGSGRPGKDKKTEEAEAARRKRDAERKKLRAERERKEAAEKAAKKEARRLQRERERAERGIHAVPEARVKTKAEVEEEAVQAEARRIAKITVDLGLPGRPTMKEKSDTSITLALLRQGQKPKGSMWQLEARAAGDAAWRVVSSQQADPLVKVEALAPGTKYSFRSREAVFDQPTKRIIWGEPSVESTYATMGDAVRTSTAATTAAAPISAKQRRKKEKSERSQEKPQLSPEEILESAKEQARNEEAKKKAQEAAMAAAAREYEREAAETARQAAAAAALAAEKKAQPAQSTRRPKPPPGRKFQPVASASAAPRKESVGEAIARQAPANRPTAPRGFVFNPMGPPPAGMSMADWRDEVALQEAMQLSLALEASKRELHGMPSDDLIQAAQEARQPARTPLAQHAGSGGRGTVCYRCMQPGHMARECPDRQRRGGGALDSGNHSGGGGGGGGQDSSEWGYGDMPGGEFATYHDPDASAEFAPDWGNGPNRVESPPATLKQETAFSPDHRAQTASSPPSHQQQQEQKASTPPLEAMFPSEGIEDDVWGDIGSKLTPEAGPARVPAPASAPVAADDDGWEKPPPGSEWDTGARDSAPPAGAPATSAAAASCGRWGDDSSTQAAAPAAPVPSAPGWGKVAPPQGAQTTPSNYGWGAEQSGQAPSGWGDAPSAQASLSTAQAYQTQTAPEPWGYDSATHAISSAAHDPWSNSQPAPACQESHYQHPAPPQQQHHYQQLQPQQQNHQQQTQQQSQQQAPPVQASSGKYRPPHATAPASAYAQTPAPAQQPVSTQQYQQQPYMQQQGYQAPQQAAYQQPHQQPPLQQPPPNQAYKQQASYQHQATWQQSGGYSGQASYVHQQPQQQAAGYCSGNSTSPQPLITPPAQTQQGGLPHQQHGKPAPRPAPRPYLQTPPLRQPQQAQQSKPFAQQPQTSQPHAHQPQGSQSQPQMPQPQPSQMQGQQPQHSQPQVLQPQSQHPQSQHPQRQQ
mmetsp:Transcript_15565/g.46967  ORF Transcript_15565/g.46967 Transcript_15565/m.46967 type:complete len:1215 (+) Transcript_15565:318-3962(+)